MTNITHLAAAATVAVLGFSGSAAMATCINCNSGSGSETPISTPINTSVQIGGAGKSTGYLESTIELPDHADHVTSTFEGYDKGTTDIMVGVTLNGDLCPGGCEEGSLNGLVTATREVGSLQTLGLTNFRDGTIKMGGVTFGDGVARLDATFKQTTGE